MTLKLMSANKMTVEASLKFTDPVAFKDQASLDAWNTLCKDKEEKAKILSDITLFNATVEKLTNSADRYKRILDEFAARGAQLVLTQENNHVFEEAVKKNGRFAYLVEGFNGWVGGVPPKDHNPIGDMGCAILVPKGGALSGWDVVECGEIHKPIVKAGKETDRAMVFAVVSNGTRTIIVGTWHLAGYGRQEPDFGKMKEGAQSGRDELNNWLASIAELKVKYPSAEVIVGGDFNESDVPAPGVKYTEDEFKTVSRIAQLRLLGFHVTTSTDGPTEILRDGGKRGGQSIDWIASTIPVTVTGSTWHKATENANGVSDDFNLLSDHRFLDVIV